jgi:hypothetical protein
MKELTKNHPLFPVFLTLSCALSPENLTCDGECSRAEVKARHAKIMARWRDAERQFGRTVSEEEVWDAEMKK